MGNTLARSVIILEANNMLSPCQTGKSILAIHWVNEWSWSLTYTTVCTNRTVSRSLYKGGDNSGCQSYTNSQFFAVIGKATCSLMITHCVLVKHLVRKSTGAGQIMWLSCDCHVGGNILLLICKLLSFGQSVLFTNLVAVILTVQCGCICSYSHILIRMIGNQVWLPLD